MKLGNNAQVRLNFSLEIKKLEQSVEVNVQADNLILDTSASSGSKLDEKKVSELPIVNSNVLSLIKVMGGVTLTENPIFGADDTQFAGVSASNVNLTRDGVTANDVRWSTRSEFPRVPESGNGRRVQDGARAGRCGNGTRQRPGIGCDPFGRQRLSRQPGVEQPEHVPGCQRVV